MSLTGTFLVKNGKRKGESIQKSEKLKKIFLQHRIKYNSKHKFVA